MTLYHGTFVEIREPEIIRSEIGRDFGFAFYTTDIKEQAERWAIRKAKLQGRRTRKAVLPIVNVYAWNYEHRDLKIKEFSGASMAWLDLVVKCRGDASFMHHYDVVVGKIADDNVGETVSYVMQGIMRREDAIERLEFEKINNQIAFCTSKSLEALSFQSSYVVEV